MRTFSKALSVLLSIAMLLSMVSVSVFAQDVELIDASDVEIVEAEEPAEELAEEPAEEEIVEDEIVEDEIVEDEIVEDEIVEDEIVEDEIVEDEIVEDEIVEDEIVEDEIVEDEIVEDEIVEDEEVALAEEEEEVFLLGATDGLYVSYTGSDETGVGSEASPYRTIAKAQDNLGNLSKIYIVDSTYSVTYGQKPENLVFYDAKSHTNTITYVGVSPDGKSGMGFSAGGGTLQINGPSVFENLTLVEGYGGYKLISLLNSGVNVTFDRVRVLPVRSGTTTQDTAPHRHDGMYLSQYGYYGKDVITFKNGDYGMISLSASGNGGGNASATITVNVENASMTSIDLTKDSYEGINSGRYNNMSYKSLFINLDNAEIINGIVQSGPVSVATIENLQVLAVNGTDLPAMSIDNAVITNKWFVKVNGGELVATTTPGRFTIPSGSTAYWYVDAKTVKYATGTLTLDAGTHEINVTDGTLADVLEAPEAPAGQTFLGWVDDGNGTIKAKFIVTVEGAVYVSHTLGNDTDGDGTLAKPYQTISAAQTALGNANGTIAIIDAEYTVPVTLQWSNPKPNMLMYDAVFHTNTITYVGVDPDGKSGMCVGPTTFSLRGPSHFKNLTLVSGYNNHPEWDFMTWTAKDSDGDSKPDTYHGGKNFSFDKVNFLDLVKGTTTTQDTAPMTNYGPMYVSDTGFWGSPTITFAKGTYGTLILTPQTNSGGPGSITLNINDATLEAVDLASTFKNYNHTNKLSKLLINIDNSTITNGIVHTYTGASSEVTDMQVLAIDGTQAPTLSLDAATITNLWVITADGTLTATATPGTLTIPAGSKVYNYVDNYTVEYVEGSITLPAGTHNLKVAEGDITKVLAAPVAPEGQIFAGWADDGEGTLTAKFYVNPGEGAIYVSHTGGNDEWDGLTIATAKKTIKGAQAALNGQDGTIAIVDAEYSVSVDSKNAPDMLTYSADAHDYKITVVGLDANGKSGIASMQGFNTNGPTEFKNLTILLGTANNKEWNYFGAANKAPGLGYSLDNVKIIQVNGTKTQDSTSPISDKLIAAPEGIIRDGHKSYEFKNGNYGVFSIAARVKEYVNSVVEVSVTDATVKALNIAKTFNSWSGDKPTEATIAAVFVTLDGENTALTDGITHTSTATGNRVTGIQVYAKNGAQLPAVSDEVKAITDNIWLVRGAAGLTATETFGKFIIPEGTSYKFTSETGTSVILSAGSDYLLQPGTWTVELVDGYEFDGTTITATADVTIDLAELVPTQTEGKTFIGWKLDGSEEALGATPTLTAGQTLVAQYIDFDNAVGADLSVLGVEVRVQSSETRPMGMRYISKFDKTYLADIIANSTEEDVLDFGSVILPANFIGGRELKADGIYGYKGAQYEPVLVTAKPENGGKIRIDATNYYEYTVVLTNIKEANYTREYTVRSYVKFKDINGVERFIYGDSYATSLFEVADYAIRNPKPGMTEKATATCQGIVDTVRNMVDNAAEDDAIYLVFDPELYEGETSYSSMTEVARADLPEDYLSEENYEAGKIFYRTEDNVRVREIHVPIPAELAAKNENIQRTIIGGVSDTHISGMTDEDRLDPELMATYNVRAWGRDGTNIPIAAKAMNFASVFDQVLLPGDILDYMSQGAINNVNKYLLEPYAEKVMITLGNHDAHKNNQSGVAEGLDIAERQSIVQAGYRTVLGDDFNIYYSSEVIKDTVMAVILENGEMTFHQDQIEKLERDIKIARENGYVMIVALHVPIRTLDASQSSVGIINSLLRSENNALNFYDDEGKGLVMMPNNDVSRAVYKLITENADVIRAVYAGHKHADYTSYLQAKTATGENAVIPQFVCNSAVYSNPAITYTVGEETFTLNLGSCNAVKFVFDVFAE